MKKYERFSECMRRLMDEKGVSATELTRRVGFKSRNSIARILNDQTSAEVEAAFLEAVREKECLQLTAEQWQELEVALEISRIGYSDYCSNKSIRSLLRTDETLSKGIVCIIWKPDQPNKLLPFSAVLQAYASCRRVNITIRGCCNENFFRELAALIYSPGLKCDISVTHYMYAGSDEIVQNVVAIQPLLYAPWYKAFWLEPDSCAMQTENMMRNSVMNVMSVNQEGGRRYLQFVMLDDHHLYVLELPGNRSDQFVNEILRHGKPRMHPVKSEFNNLLHEPQDYVQYTEDYRKLEKGRSIYSIKPDVPINFIHPDILLPSVMDGFAQQDFVPREALEPLVKQLYCIQFNRWKNIFTKRKVTHLIFTKQAMRRFALTGRQSDHFFAMRPYTPAERSAILGHLREQQINNPYFWIYFLEDESYSMRAEITYYEGQGVMFTNANTSYNLDGDHAEAMIKHPEMGRKFKNFFLKDLLANHVLDRQETIAMLDELIRMVR